MSGRASNLSATITINLDEIGHARGCIAETGAVERGSESGTPTFFSFARHLGFVAIPLAVLAGSFSGGTQTYACQVVRRSSTSEVRAFRDEVWWTVDEWTYSPDWISQSEVDALNALFALPSPNEFDFGLGEDS